MLNRAAWLGKGERPTVAVIEPVKSEPVEIDPAKIEPPPPEPAPQIEAQNYQHTAEPPAAPIIEAKPEEKPNPQLKKKMQSHCQLLSCSADHRGTRAGFFFSRRSADSERTIRADSAAAGSARSRVAGDRCAG